MAVGINRLIKATVNKSIPLTDSKFYKPKKKKQMKGGKKNLFFTQREKEFDSKTFARK